MTSAPTILVDATTRIRPWRRGDARPLYEVVDASREHIARWLPWAEEYTALSAVEFIAQAADGYRLGRYDLAIEVGGAIAGGCRFGPEQPVRRFEIGYWLSLPYTKQGIMTRCVSALTDYLFRERSARRVQIVALGENLASRAIPERLRFASQGVSEAARWHRDAWHDEAWYAITDEEWRARNVAAQQ